MKQETKLSTEQQREQTAETQTAKTTAPKQFENVEQLLRYDAAQTPVPPGIASRLNQSVEASPPRRPWWRRIFGGE